MNRFNRMSGMTLAVLEIAKIFLTVAGVFILINDGSKAYEAYTSQSWPTTTGEIITSSVDTYGDALGNRWYRSKIKYAYTVDQTASDDDYLTNDRVRVYPTPRADSRALAEIELKPYPKGSSIDVYYNPNRPEKSVLEPVFLLSYLIMPTVGLLCLGSAFALWNVGKGR